MEYIERVQWMEACQMFFDAYVKYCIDGKAYARIHDVAGEFSRYYREPFSSLDLSFGRKKGISLQAENSYQAPDQMKGNIS